MTNLVLIVLTNVAANSMVQWSNDLITWQAYAYTYVCVPRWKITTNMDGVQRAFWKYKREGE